jgi:hypothetical protein
MTVWSDMDYKMRPLPLDGETADRLLAGRVAPEDAPPGYGPVVRLLDAASAGGTAEELEHESEALVAFALALRSSEPTASVPHLRLSVPSTPTRARIVTVALAAALATTAGMVSAGALPGAAQGVASQLLDKLGVSIPGSNDRAGTSPDDRGRSGTAHSAPPAAGEVGEASQHARTSKATGVKRTAIISTTPSKGRSQAGQHGSGGTNTDVRGKPGTAPSAPAGNGGETSEVGRPTEAAAVEKGAVIPPAASKGKGQAGQHGSGGTNSDVRGKSGTAATAPAGNKSETAPRAAAGNDHRKGSEQQNESRGQHGSPPAAGAGNAPVTKPADTATGGSSSNTTSNASPANGGRSSAGASNAPSVQPRRP